MSSKTVYNEIYTFWKYGTYTIYEGDLTVLTEENYKNYDIDGDETLTSTNKNNNSYKNNQLINSEELYINEGINGKNNFMKKNQRNVIDNKSMIKKNENFQEEKMMEEGVRIYEYGDENFKKKIQVDNYHFDDNNYDTENINEKTSLMNQNNLSSMEIESDDDSNGHYLYIKKLNQRFHARKNNLQKKCCDHNHETGDPHSDSFEKNGKSEYVAMNVIRPDDR